ncbi:MAG: nucleotidyltransferase domain-containing protein [Coprothermobacterota bacterium]|nr:nucleotidyltransferase domain-containing protein [Coprothermobacterota bacterium]
MNVQHSEPQMGPENALKEQLKDQLSSMAGIRLAYLFGSHATGKAGPGSDIDLALLLDPLFLCIAEEERIRHELCLALGSDCLDMVVLNRAPIELAFAVISQGKVLLQRDLETRVEYEADTLSRYYDFLPVLREQREEILKGGEDDTRVQRNRAARERALRAFEQACPAPR